MLKIACLSLILSLVSIIHAEYVYTPKSCKQLQFLPMPKKIGCKIDNNEKYMIENPCLIAYVLPQKDNKDFAHITQLLEFQMKKTFKCHHLLVFENLDQAPKDKIPFILNIKIKDKVLKNAFTTKQEAYKLKINKKDGIVESQHYAGFVRGIQTFFQVFKCHKYQYKNCYIRHFPIEIQDEPLFTYRSLMIDTSRHFLPINIIYETIDALMYNKMNVLHWHIVDEDSFPLQLKSHPELAKYGAFSQQQIYPQQKVRQIVRYAMVRGVRVIPQIDTPGHASVWGKSPQNKNVACTLKNDQYRGPLDVTLDKTYTLINEVFAEVLDIFPDPFVHLGGDEVQLACLANKTQFLKQQNIKQDMISLQYRRKQHKILKKLDPQRKFIYWIKQQKQIKLEQGDIVHWWGKVSKKVPSTDHQIILSNTNDFYIDTGVGNRKGQPYKYGFYFTWLDLYNRNIPSIVQKAPKSKVIGAEVTLWSEVSNQYTHHVKIWIRTSSFAERLWTSQNFNAKPDFFRRITAHERILNRRGIPTAPATCQQCEFHPEFC